jgi:hypothetical protein
VLGRCVRQVDLKVFCCAFFSSQDVSTARCYRHYNRRPRSTHRLYYLGEIVTITNFACLRRHMSVTCVAFIYGDSLLYLFPLPSLQFVLMCMYPFAKRMQPRSAPNGFLVVGHSERWTISIISRTILPQRTVASPTSRRNDLNREITTSYFQLMCS